MSAVVNLPTVSMQSVKASSDGIDVASLDPAQQKQLRQLDEAAKSFEQLFVQQMLKTAKFASKVSSDGYGTMAMEAMATGVTEGGGMGLATMIRDSLIKTQLPELASTLQSIHAGSSVRSGIAANRPGLLSQATPVAQAETQRK